MNYTPEALYDLLPTIYRQRDSERGDVLRAFIRVLAEQALIVEEDIARLYDSWFIETADEWIVPYLGDLLGVRALHAVKDRNFSQRAWVANTLGYRRRKGTVAVLEQLARDVSGYPAKAVEFFSLLATTQYLNHLRPENVRTPDLRNTRSLEWIDTPFDTAPHTAEVRRIHNGQGKYNIPNIGLFLWRLESYALRGVTAQQVDARRYTFSPLDIPPPMPLFSEAADEKSLTSLATHEHVPMPLSRRLLDAELPKRYGRDMEVIVSGVVVSADDVIVCNLSDKNAAEWAHLAPAGKVAIDPVLGRIALSSDSASVRVDYHYGFSGDVGGGSYPRGEAVAEIVSQPVGWQVRWVADVQRGIVADPAKRLFNTLQAAVTAWNAQPAGTEGAIVILDSQSLNGIGLPQIRIGEGSRLIIVAGTWPDDAAPETAGHATREFAQLRMDLVRPHIDGDIRVVGTAAPGAQNAGELALSGLLLEGSLVVQNGNLARVRISHCTLVPPAGVRVAAGNDNLTLSLSRTISGDIRLPTAIRQLEILDSIIRAGELNNTFQTAVAARTTPADIQRSTIFGDLSVYSLWAGNTIFFGGVRAVRRQIGCIRFSYVRSTTTPRRYRCQPDLALAAAAEQAGLDNVDALPPSEQAAIRSRLIPSFTSREYGHPAFAQLSRACAEEIRTGADNQSEMGVFSFLSAPQREANLRVALEEYLNFGLEAGIFYVT